LPQSSSPGSATSPDPKREKNASAFFDLKKSSVRTGSSLLILTLPFGKFLENQKQEKSGSPGQNSSACFGHTSECPRTSGDQSGLWIFLLECPDLPVNPVLDDQFHLVFTHACPVAEANLHFQHVEDRLDGSKICFC